MISAWTLRCLMSMARASKATLSFGQNFLEMNFCTIRMMVEITPVSPKMRAESAFLQRAFTIYSKEEKTGVNSKTVGAKFDG